VFFTTKMDGTLDVWDLFYKHNEPTLTVQVPGARSGCIGCDGCNAHCNGVILNVGRVLSMCLQVSDQALTCFGVHEGGSNIAAGTADGTCAVLQLSAGLYEMGVNEKAAINGMFDRETQREKNLDKALKEAKVKARKEAARKDDVPDNITPEQLQALEQEFRAATVDDAA
jgi:dynein intermediate chain 2